MYNLVRDETIPEPRARGTAYTVTDEHTEAIGVVVDADLVHWRVFSAGPAVPVDQHTLHPDVDHAVTALLAARTAAAEPGGMLHVDHTGLTGFQRAVLDFAGLRFTWRGVRESTIWDRFDMSSTTYAVHLNALIDVPAATAYAPQLVARQRRLRAAAKARRTRSAS